MIVANGATFAPGTKGTVGTAPVGRLLVLAACPSPNHRQQPDLGTALVLGATGSGSCWSTG